LSIKFKITEKKRGLIANFSYLSALQVFNLLIPILTYPYLIRVLGIETYGLIIYSQAIVAYFVIVINFGFNISATKDVSIHRDDKDELSNIVSSVLIIKGMLFLSACIILGLIVLVIPLAYEYRWLLYLTMYTAFYEFLFPLWYFQGVEKMKYIAYITIINRLFFLLLIFFLVQNKKDYLLVPILNGIGTIIAGITSIWILFWHEGVDFKLQKIITLKIHFKAGLTFFYSRAISVFSDKTTIVIIGSFFGLTEVAFYDLAIKISALGRLPFNLINQTVYPRIAKTKDMLFAKKITIFSLFFSIFLYILVIFFNEKIIFFLGGEELLPAYWIILLLCLTIPTSAVSYQLGNCVLVTMGKSREFNLSVIYQVVLYLIIVGILWLSNNITLINIASSLVVAAIFEVSYRYYHAKQFLL
jgi:PST family polysaccharide transporter